MKRMLLVVLVFCGLYVQNSFARGHMVVVTNAANTQELDKDKIRAIYNDDMLQWRNGQPIKVFHLLKDSPLREVFSKNVLGVSAQDMALIWIKRENANMPRNVKQELSANRMIRMIRQNANAIGYMSEKDADHKAGVRIVYSFTY